MSTNISTDTTAIKSMRWIARIIAMPWAFWALLVTLFITGSICPHRPSSTWIVMLVLIIAFVMYVGAAIVACVWGKEKLGGCLLIADGGLLFVLFITLMIATGGLDTLYKLDRYDIVGLLTVILPPLVAGALFLTCHRKSNQGGRNEN